MLRRSIVSCSREPRQGEKQGEEQQGDLLHARNPRRPIFVFTRVGKTTGTALVSRTIASRGRGANGDGTAAHRP